MSGARDLAARLRQLLRYLHVVGVIEVPLVWAVPPVADLRGRALPKAVAPEVITALLSACDLELAIGRRDFAVLLLLSRLGLRAGEVAAIGLDDVDWRAGELLVHGKGHREDTLPLPVDVGEALVAYLRVRPVSEHRALFLCVQAPFGPVSSHVVAMIVRRACRRAQIPEVGPHSLRHTAATEMLRARVSLEEIAQVLRHRQLQSTAIYARVDFELAASTRAAVARRPAMSVPLQQALEDYLTIRRQLGYQLRSSGRLLAGFVRFVEQAGARTITTELAVAWARQPQNVAPIRWSQRLGMVRGFAGYLATIDPETEIPPADVLVRSSAARRAVYLLACRDRRR